MTGIWQVYDIGCHMTVIYLSYHWIRHVVIYIVHTGIYQSYDIGNWRVVWIIYDSLCLSYDLLLLSRRRQALRPAAESRLKCSGTQSLDCKGVYCASASLNASVPLGSRHGVAGASHRCRRRRRWPQSRTADVGSSGSVVTLPGRTSSRL
jgi:hypothetical protein